MKMISNLCFQIDMYMICIPRILLQVIISSDELSFRQCRKHVAFELSRPEIDASTKFTPSFKHLDH